MRITIRRLRTAFPVLLAMAVPACVALWAPAARADAMTFRAYQIGGPQSAPIIAATGQITDTTPERFVEFLDENPSLRGQRPVVFLDSPGGRVGASMQLGALLRQTGASAVVAGVGQDGAGSTVVTNAQCFSACVYALMGASHRVIPTKSQVGIHRMFAYEAGTDASGTVEVIRRRYDNGDMGGLLKRYTAEMGVNPALITAAEHTPSDNLKILSPADIRRWRLGRSEAVAAGGHRHRSRP